MGRLLLFLNLFVRYEPGRFVVGQLLLFIELLFSDAHQLLELIHHERCSEPGCDSGNYASQDGRFVSAHVSTSRNFDAHFTNMRMQQRGFPHQKRDWR
jgi:hypothetical protein